MQDRGTAPRPYFSSANVPLLIHRKLTLALPPSPVAGLWICRLPQTTSPRGNLSPPGRSNGHARGVDLIGEFACRDEDGLDFRVRVRRVGEHSFSLARRTTFKSRFGEDDRPAVDGGDGPLWAIDLTFPPSAAGSNSTVSVEDQCRPEPS